MTAYNYFQSTFICYDYGLKKKKEEGFAVPMATGTVQCISGSP
jgi:hypothetical protein